MLRTILRSVLPIALLSSFALAQAADGEASAAASSGQRLELKYASFDPLTTRPDLPLDLTAGADTGLWIVQFDGVPTEAGRAGVLSTGAQIHSYLPHDAYVVRMPIGVAAAVRTQPGIRYVGYYEPAYRVEPEILFALRTGLRLPKHRYTIVLVDKRRDKAALAAGITALGGVVDQLNEGSLLSYVTLDHAQFLGAARLDQVLWIERWLPSEEDMDNARQQTGANTVETVAGYTGSGVRGHVFEGVEANHPDFTTSMTAIDCGSVATHGHATAGIVFGNGTSHPNARGMAPDAVGFYTNYTCYSGNRNAVINTLVNTHQGMFTTASWGGSRTTQYTATSADADDIVFDHRIPWTNSQSNSGNPNSRPEAWAKNVISVGGVAHFDNASAVDDSWAGGSGSTGPAADGRIKPDLCSYYDEIHTSDRSGGAGYSPSNHTGSFGGTSGATPIVAGANALAIQMYTDFIFGNTPRVSGGSRFQNRPYAQTLKALQIVNARQYPFVSASVDNRREHQGWGFPHVGDMYANRGKTFIVPEDDPLEQGDSRRYLFDLGPTVSEFKVCMTFLEPMGNPAATLSAVNDLSLRVTSPTGLTFRGNVGLPFNNWSTAGGVLNTVDSVECVLIDNAQPGIWTVEVLATRVATDAHIATPETDATFALVVRGGDPIEGSLCADYSGGVNTSTGPSDLSPFGGQQVDRLVTLFAADNSGAPGGAVYFDMTVNRTIRLDQIGLNTNQVPGTPVSADIYLTAAGGTHVGNEGNPAAWTLLRSAQGDAGPFDSPTYLALDSSALVPAGTYGVAVVSHGFNHHYTDGTGVNQAYSDANISLALGSATNTPFGTVIPSRVANVELDYVALATATLPTLFNANGSGAFGGVVYFDANVHERIALHELAVNTSTAVGSPVTLELWMTPRGTPSAGNESNPLVWNRTAAGSGTSAGLNAPSVCALDQLIVLEPGTYGFMVFALNFGHEYTAGNGSNQTASDPRVTLSLSAVANVPFGGLVPGAQVANVALGYAFAPGNLVNQRYQMVVPASDLTHAGEVTGLSFAASGTGVYRFDSLVIRMGHLPPGTPLANNFGANLSSATTVMAATNHHWPVVEDEWNEVGLQQRFTYDGTSDLLIEVLSVGSSFRGSEAGFHRDTQTPRVLASGWTGGQPSAATVNDTFGQKVRVDFGCASTSVYGSNCGGLDIRVSGLPVPGQNFGFELYSAAPSQPAVIHLGFITAAPYPIPLSLLGFGDCVIWHQVAAAVPVIADTSGRASTILTGVNDPNILGVPIYGQYGQINPAGPGGIAFSGYARIVNGAAP